MAGEMQRLPDHEVMFRFYPQSTMGVGAHTIDGYVWWTMVNLLSPNIPFYSFGPECLTRSILREADSIAAQQRADALRLV